MAAGASPSSKSLSIPPGSRVSCTMCTGEKIEGEVVAFDVSQKIIVLKLASSSGAKGTCNVNFLNVDLFTDFVILEESKKVPGTLPALDMNKITQRIEHNITARSAKHRAASRIGIGVSPLAQKLFDVIRKTYQNCYWDQTRISVMDVIVSPPYSPNDCTGDPKAIDIIKKVIEKFHAEQGNGL